MNVDMEIVRKLPDGEHKIHMAGDPRLEIGDGHPRIVQDARIFYEEGTKAIEVEITHTVRALRLTGDDSPTSDDS